MQESMGTMEPSANRSTDRGQRELSAWSLLATVMLLGAMAGPFFAGRVYTRDDLGAFHIPIRAFYSEQLARDEPFDWMPQLYSGFCLTGEGQSGAYHPLHLMLYRFLPLHAAAALEWLLSYPWMFIGAWLLLRRRLRRGDAAMFGSLLFTFCAFNLLHFVHPNAIAVVAHIPWLLWAIDIVLSDPQDSKATWAQAGIALLTGSQWLLGYPQYVWFSLLVEVAYAAFLTYNRRLPGEIDFGSPAGATSDAAAGVAETAPAPRRSPLLLRPWVLQPSSRWARLVVAGACGVALGGVQLLPTIESLASSTRQTVDSSYQQFGSLHPLNLVQLVAPYFFTDRVLGGNTHEFGVYLGAVPLMLIVWLLVRRHRLGRLGPLAGATAGFGLLALWLAFGQYGGLYRLQSYLPLVGQFRCPCRYLVLFYLAMAVLAAMGFVLLVREHRRNRRYGHRCLARIVPPPLVPLGDRDGPGDTLGLSASPLIGACEDGRERAPAMALHAPLALCGWPLAVRPSPFALRPSPLGPRSATSVRRRFSLLRPRSQSSPSEALWAVVILGGVVAMGGLFLNDRPFIASMPAVLVGPILLGAAAALVSAAARGARPALVGLVLLAAVDLGAYGLTYAFYPQTDTLEHLAASAAAPPSQAQGRAIADPLKPGQLGRRVGNQLVLAGWSRADGYAGLEPRQRLDYGKLSTLRAAGVRWIRESPATAGIEGLWPAGPGWLEVPYPLPQVRLVTRAIASRNPAEDLEQVDVDSTVLVEQPLALPASSPGSVRLLAQRPGYIEAEVDCPTTQLLVVAESHHPGWQATVDELAQSVLRVNGDFLGCLVGPGRQHVVLQFQPRSLELGGLVSFVGLVLTSLCFLGGQMRPQLGPGLED